MTLTALLSSPTVPSKLVTCAFGATHRESFSRNGAQKNRAIDHSIEHLGCADGAGQFGRAFLSCSDVRFNLAPVLLHCVKPVADFQRSIGVPHVIDKQDRPERAQDHHADLERIALPLSLFQDLLVEEIEMKCHAQLVSEIFKRRAACDIK